MVLRWRGLPSALQLWQWTAVVSRAARVGSSGAGFFCPWS